MLSWDWTSDADVLTPGNHTSRTHGDAGLWEAHCKHNTRLEWFTVYCLWGKVLPCVSYWYWQRYNLDVPILYTITLVLHVAISVHSLNLLMILWILDDGIPKFFETAYWEMLLLNCWFICLCSFSRSGESWPILACDHLRLFEDTTFPYAILILSPVNI